MDTTNARAKKREEQRLARQEKAKEARVALQERIARQKRMKEEDYKDFADRQAEINSTIMKSLENFQRIINEHGKLISELKVGFTIQEIAIGLLAEKLGMGADVLSSAVRDVIKKESERKTETKAGGPVNAEESTKVEDSAPDNLDAPVE